jgi:iron complex transport system substrate-binding protein
VRHPRRQPRRPRRALVATLLAAVSVLAAACGDDDAAGTGTAGTDPGAGTTDASTGTASVETAPVDASTGVDDTSETADASAGAAPADGEFPVEVEHALGTTVVPEEPVRVVTVGVTEQDTVLAVGVVPVGVTEWYGDQPFATWPWAQDELGTAQPEVLSADDGLQYERIAALEPDLIIGTNAGLDDATYALLSDIAPTVAHPVGAALYFSPWDDQARLIGQALGRASQMDAVIADIDAQFAAAAEAHPEFAGTDVVFLQNAFSDGSAIAYQDGLSTAFLTDLGFTIPAVLDEYEQDGGQAYIPLERLAVLDEADVLVWGTEEPGDRAVLEAEPLYQALEEVQDGRLVFTDGLTAGAIYFTSPLSLPFVLEHLVPALASTLAGEGPATIDAG